MESEDSISQYFSDTTKQQENQLLFSKVRDLLSACMDGELFQKLVDRMKRANDDTFESPVELVENVTDKFGMTKTEGESVLEALCQGCDFSRLGLANAITRMAQDVEDYDRSTDLERLGGSVIEMQSENWKTLVA